MLEKVKAILGDPYYETKDCVIYNMDCVEAMQLIGKPIIDLTITSPPYNIGKEYEEVKALNFYLGWTKKWINLVYALTRNTGAFWLNLGYINIPNKATAIPLPYLIWDKVPFFLMQEVVWNYGAGVACKKRLSPRNEKWLWYVKDKDRYTFNLDAIRDREVKYPNQRKNGRLRCNTLGKNPSDVWQIAKVTSGKNRSSTERTPHPAQFPLDLINRIVGGFSNAGDLILDPFIGSGSTAEVCLRQNRKVIGFEIKREYCDIASVRIENYLEEVRISKSRLQLFERI